MVHAITTKDMTWNIGGKHAFLEINVAVARVLRDRATSWTGFSMQGPKSSCRATFNVWYLRNWEGLIKQRARFVTKTAALHVFIRQVRPLKMLLGISSDFSYKKFCGNH